MRYLESFRFKAKEAKSGEDALKFLRNPSHKVDLVLMDWKMPGLNGLDTIRYIQSDPNIPNKPKVMMISAYGRKELPEEAAMMEVETFLVKPVSPSTLLEGIFETYDLDVEQTTITQVIDSNLGSFEGTHLLLVEDNEINQQVATEILSDQGITMKVADNGTAGVEALLKEPEAFEAILMDIQMPVMDGYTAAKTIRKDKRFEKLAHYCYDSQCDGWRQRKSSCCRYE